MFKSGFRSNFGKAFGKKRATGLRITYTEAVAAGGGRREEVPAPNELSNNVEADGCLTAPRASVGVNIAIGVCLCLHVNEFTGMTGFHHQCGPVAKGCQRQAELTQVRAPVTVYRESGALGLCQLGSDIRDCIQCRVEQAFE